MVTTIIQSTRRAGGVLRSLSAEFLDLVLGIVLRAATFSEQWLTGRKKALYGLAVTRFLLGVLGAGMVLTNWSTRYYAYGAGSAWTGEHLWPGSDFATLWLTRFFHDIGEQDLLLSLAMAGLLLVSIALMLGWHTRIVMPLFLLGYVSWIEMNDLLSDQSDNLVRMVLIYMLFADPAARLSLDARRRAKNRTAVRRWSRWRSRLHPYDTMFNNLAVVVLVLHVAFIYMSGALYKAQGDTWSHGYAVYNPLHVDRFSVWPELADAITWWGPAVVAISWGTIVIQMMFLPMLATRTTRILALMGVMTFHLGIGILMGLPFFSLAMIAVDAVLVRDRTWRAMGRAIRDRWRALGAGEPARSPAKPVSGRRSAGAAPTPGSPVRVDDEAEVSQDADLVGSR
ncbi:HTTM domain-containing protein [Curtobacterium sp. P97]|uniref:HTTM domain-containing protein n=1 Tax=Curtobacterium sp. P97 TaxID=2939562 RepID=UPI002040A288|nr:HTTM domain-containing protein [Curtobacterium sp. P97]MCM3523006.1 HTTM domain-containing protein [Curtobacterium sp. P97]